MRQVYGLVLFDDQLAGVVRQTAEVFRNVHGTEHDFPTNHFVYRHMIDYKTWLLGRNIHLALAQSLRYNCPFQTSDLSVLRYG